MTRGEQHVWLPSLHLPLQCPINPGNACSDLSPAQHRLNLAINTSHPPKAALGASLLLHGPLLPRGYREGRALPRQFLRNTGAKMGSDSLKSSHRQQLREPELLCTVCFLREWNERARGECVESRYRMASEQQETGLEGRGDRKAMDCT